VIKADVSFLRDTNAKGESEPTKLNSIEETNKLKPDLCTKANKCANLNRRRDNLEIKP
jgi:hypothetical protein